VISSFNRVILHQLIIRNSRKEIIF